MSQVQNRVLVHGSSPVGSPRSGSASRDLAPSPQVAWRLIGWFGLLLTVVGLVNVGIQWYPLSFSSPEWEFTTVAQSFGALPLLTMGLAALLGSCWARGMRKSVLLLSVFLVLLSLFVAAAYGLFLLTVPLALRTANAPGGFVLQKAVVQTSVHGVCFGTAYLVAAGVSFHNLYKRRDHE